MSIGREDATRIARFCLAGTGWGSALHEDDLCVLKIVLSAGSDTEVHRFEGQTFEAALRQAAEAGALKTICLEKQIAFMARSLPSQHAGDPEDLPTPLLEERQVMQSFFSGITSAISALVHETQGERGTSSLYLSSGGRLLADRLRGQWQATDERRADLVAFRRRHAAELPPAVLRKLDRSEELLSSLRLRRERVASLALVPSEVIEQYSATNRELLSIIDGLAQKSVDGMLRPTALAWMALLHAKEKTGIERAQLATAFTIDHYADGQHAVVSSLIASSDSYLHLFAAAAPSSAGELLKRQLQSDVANAVSEMERVALLKREGGFGIDPAAWFANISRKMDLFSDVESAVRATMNPPATQRAAGF